MRVHLSAPTRRREKIAFLTSQNFAIPMMFRIKTKKKRKMACLSAHREQRFTEAIARSFIKKKMFSLMLCVPISSSHSFFPSCVKQCIQLNSKQTRSPLRSSFYLRDHTLPRSFGSLARSLRRCQNKKKQLSRAHVNSFFSFGETSIFDN